MANMPSEMFSYFAAPVTAIKGDRPMGYLRSRLRERGKFI